MIEKLCKNCIHYRWIEDYYDDGSCINEEYCDSDPNRICSYHSIACGYFIPYNFNENKESKTK